MTCTCPKTTKNGVLQTAGLDVFCPVHGRQPSTGCAACNERDKIIARLEGALRKVRARIRDVFIEDRVQDMIACRDCIDDIDAALPPAPSADAGERE